MSKIDHDPDVLAWRAELAVMSFEGSFTQIKAAVRFLELAEYDLAIKAVERAVPFWTSALSELRAIRTAVRSDPLTGEAAAEYRGERHNRRKLEPPMRSAAE